VGGGGHVSTEMQQETHAPGCIRIQKLCVCGSRPGGCLWKRKAEMLSPEFGEKMQHECAYVSRVVLFTN